MRPHPFMSSLNAEKPVASPASTLSSSLAGLAQTSPPPRALPWRRSRAVLPGLPQPQHRSVLPRNPVPVCSDILAQFSLGLSVSPCSCHLPPGCVSTCRAGGWPWGCWLPVRVLAGGWLGLSPTGWGRWAWGLGHQEVGGSLLF